MTLLGLDIGTTHCKVGVFDRFGHLLYLTSQPTPTREWADVVRTYFPAPVWDSPVHPRLVYDPHDMWETVADLLRLAVEWGQANRSSPVEAVGISSMAETGLLVDAETGEPRTPMFPWFDPFATYQAEIMKRHLDVRKRFLKTGLRPAYKYSLMKILWLMEQEVETSIGAGCAPLLEGARWLGAADYIAYCLTGAMATDYSLASRTYAFRIDKKAWDVADLADLGITNTLCLEKLFPPALPATEILGGTGAMAIDLGLAPGTPVVIAGHDHVCGSFAALAQARSDSIMDSTTSPLGNSLQNVPPGFSQALFNSIGTAESLTGVLPERPLADSDYLSGFTFGLHVIPGAIYWMGGLSASGGSVEWLRALYGKPPLDYAALDALLDNEARPPSGILYFPYLAGSGSPHSDSLARAAFVGLSASHSRADLYQAVLEGTSYELEFMRRTAQQMTGSTAQRIVAAGGGTHNSRWMQIKADVLGCPVEVLGVQETTLLGAALLGGLGAGLFASPESIDLDIPVTTFEPDANRHAAYIRLYEGYLALQEPLRSYYRKAASPD